MIKRIASHVLLSFFLVLAAQASEDGIKKLSYAELLAENQLNILKISPGMTKQQVNEIMGTSQAKVKSNLFVTNPYKHDFFTIEKDSYEVLYYLTRKYPAFTNIKLSQATAVVIKNNQVVGLGAEALNRVKGGRH